MALLNYPECPACGKALRRLHHSPKIGYLVPQPLFLVVLSYATPAALSPYSPNIYPMNPTHSLLRAHLRQRVADTFGTSLTYPREAEALAADVLRRTGERLSPSTLKRFLGLVTAEALPSRFTLDVLSAYVGAGSWEAFEIAQAVPATPTPWQQLAATARHHTRLTLQGIRQKCALAYEQAVPRTFALEHVRAFRASGQPATAFVAEGGMGKSVLLAQAVEETWLSPDAPRYEAVWAVPAARLRGAVAVGGLREWLLREAGLPPHQLPTPDWGRVYLVVDGLDELDGGPEGFDAIAGLLTDLVATHTAAPWLHVLLTLRTTAWERLAQRTPAALHSQWFGVSFDGFSGDLSNVPPLTPAEVRAVLARLRTWPEAVPVGGYDDLPPDTRRLIAHPYYLQLLLQTAIGATGPASPLELVQRFVRQRVYDGPLGFDKDAVLRDYLRALDEGRRGWQLPKAALPAATTLPAAYTALLADGILLEERGLNAFEELTVYVRFGHENLLEYLVARQLLAAVGTLTPALLHAVATQYAAAGRRVELLKWLLLFGLQRGDYAAVAEVFDVNLEEYELHALSHFLGLELRAAPAVAAALVPLLAARPAAQTYFFERFVDLSNLNCGYGHAITEYLRHKHTPEARLFGHCLLFLAALLRDDHATSRAEIAHLLAVPLAEDIHPFPLGRRMAAQVLYGHFVAPELAMALPELLATADLIPVRDEPITGFGAGYQYFVSEALFLTGRHADQLAFLADAYRRYPELHTAADNLFGQLLLAYESVALLATGQEIAAYALRQKIRLATLLPQYSWFKDYYEVLYWLTEVPFANDLPAATTLQTAIHSFAQQHAMPLLARLEKQPVAALP